MLDIDLIRNHAEKVRESISRREQFEKIDLVEEVLSKDEQWRELKGKVDDLRHERNVLSERINKAKKKGEDAYELIKQARQIPDKLDAMEEREQELRGRIDEILETLPNLLSDEVPDGHDETDNVSRKEVGERIEHDFETKSHVQVLEDLDLADFDASAETSGSGFFFLKGDAVLLDLALQRYALDKMLEEGFEPVIPPYMIRGDIVWGNVDKDFFEEIIYKVADEDLYLISTSEHALTGMLTDKDIHEDEFPVTLCGVSPCFRKEIGAHGIDEKGIYRTHQFHKIEQAVACEPADSEEWFDKLLEITTDIFSGLGLPLRWLEMCAGDLGDLKARQIDIEVWSPRREDYFEVGSCSNLTDAQARRLGVRVLRPDGEREYAHTLNNTALATSRAMVGILENFQRADGTVEIPEVLRPYMGGKELLEKQ